MAADYGVQVLVLTIRRLLNEFELYGRIAKKISLLSDKNFKNNLQFDNKSCFTKVPIFVWSDESKFNVLGSDAKQNVRRPPNKQLNPKYIKKVVKHDDASILIWSCFTASWLGPLMKIEGILNGEII